MEDAGGGRTLFQHGRHHFGNHVAGAADDDTVADQQVLAADLVLVVQGGVGDVDTADEHRLQPRHRRQHTGAPHLHEDVVERGDGLFGRILVRQGEARRPGHEAGLLLQGTVIELVDHAIDGIGQRGPRMADAAVEIEHAAHAVHAGGPRRRQKTQCAQPHQQGMLVSGYHRWIGGLPAGCRPCAGRGGFSRPTGREIPRLPGGRNGHIRARRWRFPGNLSHTIGVEGQRPPGGDAGIELAQAAGGRVAGVGKALLAPSLLRGIEGEEVVLEHQHLATHLQHGRGRALQPFGYAAHGAQVGSDVLAGDAVAAGGALDQHAVLVAQCGGQTVELGRGAVVLLALQVEQRLQATVESLDVAFRKRIGQRAHRHPVGDSTETAGGSAPHPLGG